MDSLLTWCDELHQVKGSVSQLQATLNMVMAKAPSTAQYQKLMTASESPADPIAEKVRTSLHSPQVKVAVRLKYLYDKGCMPFLAAMARINFKSPKADRFVGYLLDYQPKRDRTAIIPEDTRKHNWDETPYPPSLPPISDKRILRRVLTDKSLRQPADYLELQTEGGLGDFSNNHNKKLALRGAGMLDLALLDVLDQAFPTAHEDDVAHLQYRLTRPHVVARLAYCYNLPETLMHNVSVELALYDKLVMFQNVFLAYLGGLAASDYTFEEVRSWIAKLYAPFVSRVHADGARDDTLKRPADVAAAEFHFLIDRVNGFLLPPTQRVRYEFVFSSEEEPYACTLHVAEMELGVGTGELYVEAKKKAVQATFELNELRGRLIEYLVEVYGGENKEEKDREEREEKEKEESERHEASERQEIENHVVHDADDKADDKTDDDDYEPALPGTTASGSYGSDYSEGFSYVSTDHSSNTFSLPPATATATTTATTSINGPAHSAPTLPPTPAQLRKPLPYGALPAIPNMKKRFGKK